MTGSDQGDNMSERQRRALEEWEREHPEQTGRRVGQPVPSSVPAGWYPHPSMADTQRYWDGSQWTDHIAPGMPRQVPGLPSPEAASAAKLETWGWLGAFFFPIVGIVIGIMLVSRPSKNQGGWILGVSVASIVVYGLIVANAQSSTY